MAARKKQTLRIIFDVLDNMNHQLLLNEDQSVMASDPDEVIDWAFSQMQQRFNRTDIHLSRVRICAG